MVLAMTEQLGTNLSASNAAGHRPVSTQVSGTYEDALRAVMDLVERRQLSNVSSISISARTQTYGIEAALWEIEVEGELP